MIDWTRRVSEAIPYYDRIAMEYDSRTFPRFWAICDAILESVLVQHVPATPSRWMDVGGGTGRWSEWLWRRTGSMPTLVEPSAGMSRVAVERLRRASGREDWCPTIAWGEALPLPTGSFDGAISLNNVLGLAEDAAAFMGEVGRVLVRGGVAIVSYARPTAAARYMLHRHHPHVARSLLRDSSFIAPWGDHRIWCYGAVVVRHLANSAGLDVLADLGFPRLLTPHPDVEASLAELDPEALVSAELEMLGTPGDDLCYTRLLVLQQKEDDHDSAR